MRDYPEFEYKLNVEYNTVIEQVLILYFAVHIKLVIAFHKQYLHKRGWVLIDYHN